MGQSARRQIIFWHLAHILDDFALNFYVLLTQLLHFIQGFGNGYFLLLSQRLHIGRINLAGQFQIFHCNLFDFIDGL